MGLREMQDMEQLLVRGAGRHDLHPVECCRECAEKNRLLEERMNRPRVNVGVTPYRKHPWWDRVSPWLQVAAVWGVLAWLVIYAPQQCHELGQWLSQ